MLDGLPPETDNLAVGEHDLEAGHVVRRNAVGERVRAAGVLGDVAAQGARLLAGRIRDEMQSVRRGGGGEMQIDHAGLHDGAEVRGVDLDDAGHPRERHDDAALDGDRSAREARAGAARDDRHRVFVAEPREGRDIRRAFRQDHRVRRRRVDRTVVLIDHEVGARAEHLRRSEEID